jgi:hypothetical protein
MFGTKLNIPDSAAGKMTELVSKAGREEKDTDVLMWVSTAKDKPTGQMKAQLRGVGTTSFFQKARNAFLARSAASKENIKNLFMQRGMTPEEASSALAKVDTIGKHYSAKSVNKALQTFDDARREQVKKTGESPNTKASIITNDAIDGGKVSIGLTLDRLGDDYLPDYDPREQKINWR